MIWKSALKFDQELLLTVRDNGKGLCQEELDEWNESFSQLPSSEFLRCNAEGSLGLSNIAQRLHLIYGQGASLSVDGSLGQGLAATITIPLQEKRG